MIDNRKELQDYLVSKKEEIIETRKILEEYKNKRNNLIKEQELIELKIADSFDNKDKLQNIVSEKKQLNEYLCTIIGLSNEISHTEELLSNLEFDYEMCKQELDCTI